MKQDSSHPTGVAETSTSTQLETTRARERKADAAVDMYVEKDKTLKQICKKLGYPTEVAALAAIEKRMQEYLRFHPRSVASMREMAGRRLERLQRSVAAKAFDPEHPEHLAAVAAMRGIITDWGKLYGIQAPSQVIVTNPTADAIEQIAHQMTAQSVTEEMGEGDIFGDDADDAEVRALEQRRLDLENDIVDAEIVEEEDPAAELRDV